MKIYTNCNNEIISLDNVPSNYEFVFDVDQSRNELFGKLCDAVLQGYKYEPQYELLYNGEGSDARDEESGELLYKMDEDGNKNLIGYSCYPFVDYTTLMLIQKQYEDSQRQVQALNAQIEYLSMMSGIETEVNHE